MQCRQFENIVLQISSNRLSNVLNSLNLQFNSLIFESALDMYFCRYILKRVICDFNEARLLCNLAVKLLPDKVCIKVNSNE